ncbi:MAG: 2Fe-2S iron-sulfur cluster binding domain-containing protein [Gammaproteobacteria bacterium]|nr:2Fe-2S iron-sulfur cluster binding domain-containing protein [Gammaproteobacteria bacterium]MCP5200256.1 2Fe-2S iron-sulfur cluster binding domain-containing protein [Gammaproteobacteria bacterium]
MDVERCTVRVRVFGTEDSFAMPRDGRTVLEAARGAGIDLPSSCEAGSCSTCRARLTAGRVHLLGNLALDDDELAQGYVLACQAVPESAELALDFDA